MHFRRAGLGHMIAALTVVGLAACASQPSISPQPTRQLAQSVQPNVGPNTPPTPIPLLPGMSIGVNTFPDGDTTTGGQGQKIDHLLECHSYLNETFHIHVHLSIFDPTGTQIMVPWAIGIVAPWTFNQQGNEVIGGTCFYTLHTHDRSGVIHDESKTDLGLTLGTFFDVWGMPLSTTNVAGYTGTVWVKIITPTTESPWSSSIDPRTIVLSEHEQISLAVVNPVRPVPKYHFTY
jgi:hypothetical protein